MSKKSRDGTFVVIAIDGSYINTTQYSSKFEAVVGLLTRGVAQDIKTMLPSIVSEVERRWSEEWLPCPGREVCHGERHLCGECGDVYLTCHNSVRCSIHSERLAAAELSRPSDEDAEEKLSTYLELAQLAQTNGLIVRYVDDDDCKVIVYVEDENEERNAAVASILQSNVSKDIEVVVRSIYATKLYAEESTSDQESTICCTECEQVLKH